MKIAVIDIGTLKVKMLMGNVTSSNKFETLYQSNTLTCLGVRMTENNNRPQEKNLNQTLEELKRCEKLLRQAKVEKVRVVSTHALREMGEVGNEIANKIRKEVGMKIEIISQDEEAQLFFNAVMRDFKTDSDFTVVDVGGGSVQILIGNKHKLKHKYLLKTGAQYLFDNFTPRHTGSDFPTREEIRNMQDYVIRELAPVPKAIETPVIYGSSCIIDVFKQIGLNMQKYYLSKSHPFRADVNELEKFSEKITPIPYDEREKNYQLDQKYYLWGIEKAFINILEICKKERSPFIIPSNSNINDGLVMSMRE
ncbi:hypothetical protein IPM62_02200 [Candidatus Woesebacteria bacterium]|nr:MAG: hypothetical protein IPM62_02200 [Candidatus Woesebacteria bacterium]